MVSDPRATSTARPVRPGADELPVRLAPVLERHLGKPVTIDAWRPAAQGFSTESYLFDCVDADGARERLVLRRPPEISLFPDYDLLRQVRVMNALQATDLQVPRVLWLDRSADDLGTEYFVMEHIDSAGTASDFPSYHEAGMYLDAAPDDRRTMWWGCVDTIAQVHQLDVDALDLQFLAYPGHGREPLAQVVNYLTEALPWAAGGRQQPVLERGIDWLNANLYTPDHLVLCWGDSRLSNILYGESYEVRAVLDWEVAYLGDHEADLAWLLFLDWASTVHRGLEPLPGTPSRSDVIDRYERATGWTVRNLRFNEVLAALVLACPLLRIEAKLRNDGLIDEATDLAGFCSVRVDELISTSGGRR